MFIQVQDKFCIGSEKYLSFNWFVEIFAKNYGPFSPKLGEEICSKQKIQGATKLTFFLLFFASNDCYSRNKLGHHLKPSTDDICPGVHRFHVDSLYNKRQSEDFFFKFLNLNFLLCDLKNLVPEAIWPARRYVQPGSPG